jgi:hypothetical protein
MDIFDLYSTRIQKTFDEDQAEIVSILKANPNKLLKVINYYKGLPLSYPATISSIDRGTVDLEVKAEQAFVIEDNRSTFIRSPLFKYDVFAQVQYVNIKKRAAFFAKFSYVEIQAERRNFIRMAMDPKPGTVIESPVGNFTGEIFDISLSGLNVLINDSCPLEINSETSIRFALMDIEQNAKFNISVPARLIAIKGDHRPYSYIFTISLDKTAERQISKYIFQRQLEVIREIKDATDV